jgi:uncharacterized protein with NRDE domain
MCLLALFYRAVEDAAIVLGANREEFYARDGKAPQVLDLPVRAAAGVDPVAGGTWLGVNQYGVVVAVTNRPISHVPARPRSRGLLTRDLLGQPSAAAAAEYAVRELESKLYAGCNFLLADGKSAVVIHGGDWLRIRPLPPGLHLLANGDVNDEADARLAYALSVLQQAKYTQAEECVTALRRLLGLREPGRPPVCLRLDDRGTVSSSILSLPQHLGDGKYLHAQGPPDLTPFADYSDLLKRLSSGGW